MSKIAACLICKDSRATIERAIDSIRPWVDEINIYDTGSTDGTPDFLEGLNAKTEHILEGPDGTSQVIPLAPIRVQRGEWRDDFAWARQQSIEMCSEDVDWFVWLDDDDEVVGAHWLRQLAATAHESLDGYVMFYEYAHDEAGNLACHLWRERLVRLYREGGWKWVNPVHEVWITFDRPPSYMQLPPEQVRYVHTRPPDRYPPTRNLDILLKEAERCAAAGEEIDLRNVAYLGTEHMSQGHFAEAVDWFDRYLADPRSNPCDERSQVYHKLAACLLALGKPLAAIDVEWRAIRERDDWSENYLGLAQAYASLNDWPRVIRQCQRAMDLGAPKTVLIVNPLEHSLLPHMLLANAYGSLNEFEKAAEHLQKALAMAPHDQSLQQMAAMLQFGGMQHEIVEALMKLREICIRFDENWKAYQIIKHAPYVVSEHPVIVSAKAMTTENVRHALEPEEYERWYAEEPKESTVPDEWVPEAGNYMERARFTLELLQQIEAERGYKPIAFDAGCNDAWMSCYLWVAGKFRCDGVELNKASCEKAKGRVARFGNPSKIRQGNILRAHEQFDNHRYDVVTCFEVLEHVPDTTALFEALEKLVRPDGYVVLTTPAGAFEQGNIPLWSIVERKGHLRAIPVQEFWEMLAERGKVQDFRAHQNNRLLYGSYTPGARKGKVAFFAGGAFEPWSPLSINDGGVGGSETALVQVATRLAERDFDVTVYTDCQPGNYGGVMYRPAAAFDPSVRRDAVIVSRLPGTFDVQINAPVRALWCHDNNYDGQMTPERMERMTDVITLSNWERERFATRYPDIASKLRIIRNGISLTPFPEDIPGFGERFPRVIYSSSADRGLATLLEVWPAIRANVPDAELHVFYGWDVFDRVASLNPAMQAFKASIINRVAELGGEEGGVYMRGRIGQRDLAEEMQKARVWGYSSHFLETSCIGAMEARAAGLAIVTTDLGALAETVGDHGVLIPPDATDGDSVTLGEEYGEAFAAHVAQALSDEQRWQTLSAAAHDGFRENDWELRVDEWEQMIIPATGASAPTRRRKDKVTA